MPLSLVSVAYITQSAVERVTETPFWSALLLEVEKFEAKKLLMRDKGDATHTFCIPLTLTLKFVATLTLDSISLQLIWTASPDAGVNF